MKMHLLKKHGPVLLAAVVMMATACVSDIRLSNVDVQGTYLLIDPININLAADSGMQATIFAKRKDGSPIANMDFQIQVDFCSIEPETIKTDEQGVGRANIVPQESGRYKVRMQANLNSFQLDLESPIEVNVLPIMENQSNNKALPTNIPLSLQVPILQETGELDVDYTKTIRFESNDKLATLPNPYTFVPQDRGMKMFSAAFVLRSVGEQYIRVVEEETGKVLLQQEMVMVASQVAVVIEDFSIGPKEIFQADEQDEASVTFVVADSNGVLLEDKLVSLQLGGTDNMISNATRTDAKGLAKFIVRSSKAELKSITIVIDNAGTLALLPRAESLHFVAGPAAKLRFEQVPNIQLAGVVLDPAPSVYVVDAYGNLVQQGSYEITLSLLGSSEVLQGNTLLASAAGIALFDSVSVAQVAAQARLQATAPGLTSAVSRSMQILANSPAQLVFVSQPPAALLAGELVPALQIQVQDTWGNPITDFNQPITLSLASGPNGGLQGNLEVVPTFGIALLTNIRITQAGTQSLLASSIGLPSQSSLPFEVSAGDVSVAASTFVAAPNPLIADGVSSVAINLILRDIYNNPVADMSVQVGANHGNVTLVPASATTDSQGMLQLTATSTYAGPITVTAVVGGLSTLSVDLLGLPGLPAEEQSVCALDGNQLIANLQEQRAVVCTIRDAYGNSVPGVVVEAYADAFEDSLLPQIGSTNDQGIFNSIFKTSLAGSKVITLTINGFTKTLVLVARPGPLSIAHSMLFATPEQLVADNISVANIALYTMDAYSNPLPNQGVFLFSSGTGQTIAPSGGFSDSNGVFVATIRSSVAEEKMLVVNTVNGSISTLIRFSWPICNGDMLLPVAPLLSVGATPAELVHADFNRDGKMDIAATSTNDHGVYVYLGNGNGTFKQPIILSAYWYPDSMTSADMNRDNITDLVVVLRGSNEIGIYLGVGDGTFTEPTRYATGSYPFDVGVADLNRDTFPDVVVVNLDSDTIGVYYGSAGGALSAPTNFATENQPTSVTIFDSNRDGRLDIVVGAWNHMVGVYTGRASGFNNRVTYYGNFTQAINQGDFNRDGIMDIATNNYWGNEVNILIGQSNGTFAWPVPYPAGNKTWNSFVADINADGSPDILMGNQDNNFSVLLGKGDGSFWPKVSYDVGNSPLNVVAADFNQDGKLDVATSNYYGNTLSLLLGQGNGTFAVIPTYGLESIAASNINNVALADLDQDGYGDIVAADWSSIQIKWGSSAGKFDEVSSYPSATPTVMVETGDIDGDSLVDILACWRDSSTIVWMRNLGSKNFAAPVTLLSNGSNVYNIYLVDFNQDTVLDLAHINYEWPRTVSIRLGQGNGTFAGANTYTLGDKSTHLAFGKLNGDNHVDLVASNSDNDNIRVFFGQGNGTFTVGPVLNVGSRPRGVAIGDVTGDGYNDILVAHQAGYAGVGLLSGFGNGTFATWTDVTVPVSGYDLALADINQDSRLDLVFSSHDSLYVAYHVSGSTFDSLLPYPISRNGWNPVSVGPVGQGTAYFDVMDLNNDNKLDVVIGATEEGSFDEKLVSVLIHAEQDGFLPTRYISNGAFVANVTSGDINEDGVLDMVAINPNSNTVSLLLGQQGSVQLASAGTLEVGKVPTDVLVTDVNRDGLQDIVATNWQFHGVAVLYGQPGISFAPAEQIATGWNPVAIKSGDMDNDGLAEVVVANRGSNSITILSLRNESVLQVVATWSLPFAPLDFVLADANRDNLLDVIYVAPNNHVAGVVYNNGSYVSGSHVQIAVDQRPVAINTGDLNKDGYQDILVANNTSSTISLLFNTGDALAPYVLNQTVPTALNPTDVAAVDMHGDGLLDIVLLSRGNNILSVIRGLANNQFANATNYPTGTGPGSFSLQDNNKDSNMDIAVACIDDGTLRMYSYQGVCAIP